MIPPSTQASSLTLRRLLGGGSIAVFPLFATVGSSSCSPRRKNSAESSMLLKSEVSETWKVSIAFSSQIWHKSRALFYRFVSTKIDRQKAHMSKPENHCLTILGQTHPLKQI